MDIFEDRAIAVSKRHIPDVDKRRIGHWDSLTLWKGGHCIGRNAYHQIEDHRVYACIDSLKTTIRGTGSELNVVAVAAV